MAYIKHSLVLAVDAKYDDRTYRLVWDAEHRAFNYAYPYDVERRTFLCSFTNPQRQQALNSVASAVGRVVVSNAGESYSGTGFFFMHNSYVLTSAELVYQGDVPSIPDIKYYKRNHCTFSTSCMLDTPARIQLDPNKIEIELVYLTRNLALFKATSPSSTPLIPSNMGPAPLPVDAYIVGYPGPLTLKEAEDLHATLSAEDKKKVPKPIAEVLRDFPSKQKSCFPGKILERDTSQYHKGELHTSCSAWRGCTGAPAFAFFGDEIRLVAMLIRGSNTNENTLLSCESEEFQQIIAQCKI
eukprot:Phypoly_transcript_14924.p1 GENE.Phypoly_transcript_14924~~Phypoly_transcript_14924.p1  ORF type:complete len:315 (+),score=32.82 Phypoly_transcript_14924:52-945(+)